MTKIAEDLPCDILTDANHTDDITLLVSPCGCIEQDLQSNTSLGHQRELEVSRLLSAQGLVDDALDTSAMLRRNELLDERVTHHFLRGVTD